MQLEEPVASTIKNGKDRYYYEIPEDMAKSGESDEPQSQKHRNMQDDKIIQGNPEAIPKIVVLSALVSQHDLQYNHYHKEQVQHKHLIVNPTTLPLLQDDQHVNRPS